MKNQKNHPQLGIPAEARAACGFSETDMLELHGSEGALVITKSRMTALELVSAIDTISFIASELTVALASACGLCDNCGEQRDAAPDSRSTPSNSPCCPARDESDSDTRCSEACAFLNGCKDTPADWVENCSLCRELMDESQKIQIPGDILADAGIPRGAKLEASSDGEGEIVVTEAEYQKDINDVPPGILSVLAASGVCLAELDELIMQEEIVYGE